VVYLGDAVDETLAGLEMGGEGSNMGTEVSVLAVGD